jgi:predicted aldo/keto reductase-like oxidoreductase
MASAKSVGDFGEYLAAAYLSLVNEITTVLIVPHGASADIIFEYKLNLYRCQVKTATKIEKARLNWRFDLRRGLHAQNRPYKRNSIDLFALVSLGHKNVVFMLPQTKNQITISDEHMKNNDALKNLQNIISEIN